MTSAQYRKRLEEILKAFWIDDEQDPTEALQAILALNEQAIGEDEQETWTDREAAITHIRVFSETRNEYRKQLRTIIGKGK